jgi:hypothetical protein
MSESDPRFDRCAELLEQALLRVTALESQLAAAQKDADRQANLYKVAFNRAEDRGRLLTEMEKQLTKMREALPAIVSALNGETLSMRNGSRDWLIQRIEAALAKPTADECPNCGNQPRERTAAASEEHICVICGKTYFVAEKEEA